MLFKHGTNITLKSEEDIDIKRLTNAEVGAALDFEIDKFQKWFSEQNNDGLIQVERAILKTYLAWKLLYESLDSGQS